MPDILVAGRQRRVPPSPPHPRIQGNMGRIRQPGRIACQAGPKSITQVCRALPVRPFAPRPADSAPHHGRA